MAVLYGSLVIVIVVLCYKKKCQRNLISNSVSLTAFSGPAQEFGNESTPTNLSDEEREFDNLVQEYQRVRQYSANLENVRRTLSFSG